jgi:hypothetical protein
MLIIFKKMRGYCKYAFACTSILASYLSATSMVYNFRVAQITKQPIFKQENHRQHMVIGLPFDQWYHKHSGENHNFAGMLASYIFDYHHYYLRVDGAVSSIQSWNRCSTLYHGRATDDILFTVGRNLRFERHHTTSTFSALFGVPTHHIHELQHPDFGYGQVGLGVQYDGLYEFNHSANFVYGTRYIYFVPRTALDSACKKHKFSIGNIADILVASKNNGEHHGVEVGYTARFDFGAHCSPSFDEIVYKTNYIRSNFYAVYKYMFKTGDIAHRFLFDVGYSFDHTPKKFGNKFILTCWVAWNVNF